MCVHTYRERGGGGQGCVCNNNTKQMSIYMCVCAHTHTEAIKTTDNDGVRERKKNLFSVVLSHKPLCANGVYKTIILYISQCSAL